MADARPWHVRGGIGAVALLGTGLAIARATRNRRERWLWPWIALRTRWWRSAASSSSVRALYSFTFTYYFVALTPFLALCMAWGLRRTFPASGARQLLAAALAHRRGGVRVRAQGHAQRRMELSRRVARAGSTSCTAGSRSGGAPVRVLQQPHRQVRAAATRRRRGASPEASTPTPSASTGSCPSSTT